MDNYHDAGHRLRIHDKRQRTQDSDSVDAAVRPIMKQEDITNAKEWSKELYDPEGLGWRPTIGRLANRVEELERENARLRDRNEAWSNLAAKYSEENNELFAEVERWKRNFLPFAAVHCQQYGKERWGDGYLHPEHYDLLAEAGARMDDFKRADLSNVGHHSRPEAQP